MNHLYLTGRLRFISAKPNLPVPPLLREKVYLLDVDPKSMYLH